MYQKLLVLIALLLANISATIAQDSIEKTKDPHKKVRKHVLPGKLKIEKLEIGTVSAMGKIEISQEDILQAGVSQIVCLLSWSGNGSGKSAEIQWIYEDLDFLIDRSFYDFPNWDGGKAEFTLPAPANNWPAGYYRIDVVENDNVLLTKSFKVSKKDN